MANLYATTSSMSLLMVGVNFSATNQVTLASKCIEMAQNEINKHLCKRYDISSSTFQTTTSIPPLVTSLTEQLACAYLYRFMSRAGAGKETRLLTKEMMSEVNQNLKDILDYKMDLLDTAGSKVTERTDTQARVLCNTSTYTTTFDEDDPLDWKVDTDKLTDISSARN